MHEFLFVSVFERRADLARQFDYVWQIGRDGVRQTGSVDEFHYEEGKAVILTNIVN
jgi:hypothetical protein